MRTLRPMDTATVGVGDKVMAHLTIDGCERITFRPSLGAVSQTWRHAQMGKYEQVIGWDSRQGQSVAVQQRTVGGTSLDRSHRRIVPSNALVTMWDCHEIAVMSRNATLCHPPLPPPWPTYRVKRADALHTVLVSFQTSQH